MVRAKILIEDRVFNNIEKSDLIREGNIELQQFRTLKQSKKKNRCNTCVHRIKRLEKRIETRDIFGRNTTKFSGPCYYYCGIGGFKIDSPKTSICNKLKTRKIYKAKKRV